MGDTGVVSWTWMLDKVNGAGGGTRECLGETGSVCCTPTGEKVNGADRFSESYPFGIDWPGERLFSVDSSQVVLGGVMRLPAWAPFCGVYCVAESITSESADLD